MEPVINKEPEPVISKEPTAGSMRTLRFPLFPTAKRWAHMMVWCHIKDFIAGLRGRPQWRVRHYMHNTKGPSHKADLALFGRSAQIIAKAEDERIFNEMCKVGSQRRGHKVGENAI